jgi:hypothetical protein
MMVTEMAKNGKLWIKSSVDGIKETFTKLCRYWQLS